MAELTDVIVTSIILSSAVLQLIGFFTPYWACTIPKRDAAQNGVYDEQTGYWYTTPANTSAINNGTCSMGGLYFSCQDGCNTEGMEDDILGLCVTTVLMNVVLVPWILVKAYRLLKEHKKYEFDRQQWLLHGVFFIGQLFAGIAGCIVLARYDSFGWSSVLFCSLGFLVVVILGVIVSIYICIKCANDKD